MTAGRALAIVGALGAARAAAADPARDTCEVHVTGAVKADLAASHPRGAHADAASAATDYWLTDDDLRARLQEMLDVTSKNHGDVQHARSVDDAMKHDPRLVVLQLRCGDDDGALVFVPAPRTRYQDVPFAPGSYALVALRGAKPGQFQTSFSLGKGASYESFTVVAGKLLITSFDAGGIAGTFHFTATGRKARKITVDGKFDFGCAGGHRCR